MPTTIKLKNSVTTTSAPSSLVQGEVAINITDKKVWVGNAATTPIQLLGDGGSGSFTSIAFGAGTVSSPSITFTGDTNTGIYSPAADTIAFTEGGAEAMRINSSGFVGIGTNNPTNLFHVKSAGSSTVALFGDSEANNTLAVTRTVSNEGYLGLAALSFQGAITGGPQLLFYTSTSSGGSPTERMRITSSGDVGIGTGSPSQKLEVNSGNALIGNSVSNNQLIVSRTGPNASSFAIQAYTDAVSLNYTYTNQGLKIYDATAGAERIRIDTSGNVGIGTTTPLGKLEVRGNGNTAFYLHTGNNAGDNSLIYFGDTGSATVGLLAYDHGTNSMSFHTNSTERMRIDSSGNVSLGTTTPAYLGNPTDLCQIAVNRVPSSGVITNSARSAAFINLDGSSGGSSIQFATAAANNTNPTERMRIDSSGNVGIGTSTIVGKLDVKTANVQPATANYAQKAFIANIPYSTTNIIGSMLSGWDGSTIHGVDIGYAYNGTGYNMMFSTNDDTVGNPVERMRITSGGYVKASNTGTYENATGTYHEFLTDKNDSIIEFENTATSGNVYGAQIELGGQTPNNTTSKFLSCGDTTNEKCVIYSSGTITNRTGTYNSFSDLKLKQDVVDASSQWDDIKAVRVRKFRLKDDVAANPNAKTMIGVIAQELEQTSAGLIDDCVDKDGEVTKAVKYSILYMKAIKALQEAMERIEKLETKVTQLESK